MANKTPIRAVFNDSNVATGLAEFQSGDTIGLTHGGLGASLSIGSAGQVLKVNSGASALEFGFVEAVVNIDSATNLESVTLATGDKFLISDGGTEGRATLAQVDTLFSGTSKTLTNKTISGSSNTLSNIGNSSLSNSAVTVGSTAISLGASSTTLAGLTSVTSGTVNIADRHIKTTDSTNLVLNEAIDISSAGAITGGSLNLSGNAVISGNLTVSGTTTSIETTNTAVTDNLFELNKGETNNTNDSGLIIERGSAGDNAIMMWDESADKFVVATTTATADSSGNISHTKANFEAADVKGSTGTFTSTGIGNVLSVTGSGDTNSEGPNLVIKRNSDSPADDDNLGALVFKGENDADEAVTYGKIRATALDVSNGTEDGQLGFLTIVNGSSTNLATLDSTGLFLNTGLDLIFEGSGADAHETTLTVTNPDADRTITLPNATGTVVLKDTTDTLTNKTISGSNNTLSNIGNSSLSNSAVTIADDSSTAVSVPLGGGFTILGGSGITTSLNGSEMTIATDGAVVTETSTDTLTNKTINSNANTLHIDLDDLATFTGTLAEFNAGLQGDSFVSLTGSETLTNKSIDSDNNTITNIVNADIKSSAAIAFSKMENLTTARALVSDSNGDVSVSDVTSTEIGYLDGVSSAIQTQLDNKAAKSFAIAQAVALG